jgi:hypothetical protein
VPHRVYSVHCQSIEFGRTSVVSPWGPLWHNFFVQHLDLCVHLLQDLILSSDDAHIIADFLKDYGAILYVLVQCYSGIVTLQYYLLHLFLQLLRLLVLLPTGPVVDFLVAAQCE